MCYVQHTCKKLNFHNGIKNAVTLPNTPTLRSIFLNCKKHISISIYRVSQEERTKLREGVPYVKLYRYNPKHLYPKLNGCGDNGQRISKLWQLFLTYWLPNTYWNWQECVVSVMLISVLNIKLTCEWHKAIKLNYKNTHTHVTLSLGLPSTVHIGSNELLSYRVGQSLCCHRNAYRNAHSRSMRYTAVDVQYAEMHDVHTFLWPLSL